MWCEGQLWCRRDGCGNGTVNGTTGAQAAQSFLDDAAIAEVMNYLNRTYGPRLVRKIVKHLPHPRCRQDPGPQPGTTPSPTELQQRG